MKVSRMGDVRVEEHEGTLVKKDRGGNKNVSLYEFRFCDGGVLVVKAKPMMLSSSVQNRMSESYGKSAASSSPGNFRSSSGVKGSSPLPKDVPQCVFLALAIKRR